MDSLAILQRFGSGELIDDLAAALIAISAEVVETGNPGKVTVSIVVKSEGQGEPIIIAEPSITRTTPKRESRGAFFFAVDGELHREDPRQLSLELRAVDTTTGEIRNIANDRVERTAP